MEFYFAPLEGVTGFTYRNAYNDLFDDVDKYYAPFISPSINDRLKGKEIFCRKTIIKGLIWCHKFWQIGQITL